MTGSHAAKFGIDINWGSVLNEYQRTNAGMTYTLQNGTPRSISLALSPRNERERFHSVAMYGQDQWTVKRLTVNAGVRLDLHNSSVSEQESGPGPFVPAQSWPKVEDVPNWRDLSPRLGVAYDLFGNGRTAVKATFNRYVVRDNTAFAAQNNPLLFNATATRTWTDANRDFVTQESELGPLSNRNFGTAVPTTTVDDEVREGWGVRADNWEWSAGVQHELTPRVSLTAGYFHRSFGNFLVLDNRAVTPADYDPFCIMAPADSRLPGGGGNLVCDLYDLNPAKLGQVDNLRTSADHYGTQKETFDGMDISATMRLPRRTQISGGLSSGTSFNVGNALTNSTEACFVVDSPGALRFCDQPVPWLTQVKFLGTVGLPWEIDLGVTFQNSPGPEILASYTVNSTQVIGLGRPLSTGTATVPLIERATEFGDRVNQVDIRLGKTFRYRAARIRALLDIGNLFNASTVLLQNNTYGAELAAARVHHPRAHVQAGRAGGFLEAGGWGLGRAWRLGAGAGSAGEERMSRERKTGRINRREFLRNGAAAGAGAGATALVGLTHAGRRGAGSALAPGGRRRRRGFGRRRHAGGDSRPRPEGVRHRRRGKLRHRRARDHQPGQRGAGRRHRPAEEVRRGRFGRPRVPGEHPA